MIQKISKMNKVDIKFQMWFQTLEVNGYIYFVGEHENKIKKAQKAVLIIVKLVGFTDKEDFNRLFRTCMFSKGVSCCTDLLVNGQTTAYFQFIFMYLFFFVFFVGLISFSSSIISRKHVEQWDFTLKRPF